MTTDVVIAASTQFSWGGINWVGKNAVSGWLDIRIDLVSSIGIYAGRPANMKNSAGAHVLIEGLDEFIAERYKNSSSLLASEGIEAGEQGYFIHIPPKQNAIRVSMKIGGVKLDTENIDAAVHLTARLFFDKIDADGKVEIEESHNPPVDLPVLFSPTLPIHSWSMIHLKSKELIIMTLPFTFTLVTLAVAIVGFVLGPVTAGDAGAGQTFAGDLIPDIVTHSGPLAIIAYLLVVIALVAAIAERFTEILISLFRAPGRHHLEVDLEAADRAWRVDRKNIANQSDLRKREHLLYHYKDQTKRLALLIGMLFGAIFAALVDLPFLDVLIGTSTSRDGDLWNAARFTEILLVAMLIAGGAQPLHDLLASLQKSVRNFAKLK